MAGRTTSVAGHAAGIAGHGGAYHQRCGSYHQRCGSRFLAGTWDTAGRWSPIMRCRSPRKTETCNNRIRTCNKSRAHSARTGYHCTISVARRPGSVCPGGVWRPCQVFVGPLPLVSRVVPSASPGVAGRATSVTGHSAGVAGLGFWLGPGTLQAAGDP